MSCGDLGFQTGTFCYKITSAQAVAENMDFNRRSVVPVIFLVLIDVEFCGQIHFKIRKSCGIHRGIGVAFI
jgi:hypothetical protein